jgi:hypothetical protein
MQCFRDNPCFDCVCFAACKHKDFNNLKKCPIIYNYIYGPLWKKNSYTEALYRITAISEQLENPPWKKRFIDFCNKEKYFDYWFVVEHGLA